MPTITIKAILPKAGKLVDDKKLGREIRNALDHTANIIRDDFKKTIKTWNHKPTFNKSVKFRKAEVSTTDEIYGFVVRGTRAHPITPKAGGLLRFRSGFKAKSRPRIISSRPGGSSGPFVTAKRVSHPGTKPRDFDKEIAKRRKKNLNNLVRLAINRSIPGFSASRSRR